MILANEHFVPEIGKIYRDKKVRDDNGNIVTATFLVIREATREEYIADLPEGVLPVIHTPYYKYWLISTD